MSHADVTDTRPAADPAPRTRPARRGRGIVVRSAAAATLALVGMAGMVGTGNAAVPSVSPAAATTAAAPEYWGGIAFSNRTGSIGASWDSPSSAAASRSAASHCGAGDCRTVVTVRSGCAALAQASNRRLGAAWAASLGEAERAAIRVTPGRNVHIIGWTCTTGHR